MSLQVAKLAKSAGVQILIFPTVCVCVCVCVCVFILLHLQWMTAAAPSSSRGMRISTNLLEGSTDHGRAVRRGRASAVIMKSKKQIMIQ